MPSWPARALKKKFMTMTPATSFSRLALLRRLFAASSLCLLAACSAGPPGEPGAGRKIDWVATSPAVGSLARWEHRSFPGKKSTLYLATRVDGREVTAGRCARKERYPCGIFVGFLEPLMFTTAQFCE